MCDSGVAKYCPCPDDKWHSNVTKHWNPSVPFLSDFISVNLSFRDFSSFEFSFCDLRFFEFFFLVQYFFFLWRFRFFDVSFLTVMILKSQYFRSFSTKPFLTVSVICGQFRLIFADASISHHLSPVFYLKCSMVCTNGVPQKSFNNHSPISRWWLDHANDGPSEATDFCEGFVDSCRFSLSSDVQLVAQWGKKVSGEDFWHFWSRLPQRLRATRSSNFRPLYVRCVALDRIQVAYCWESFLMQDMCDQRGITTVDVDLRLQGPVPYGMVWVQYCLAFLQFFQTSVWNCNEKSLRHARKGLDGHRRSPLHTDQDIARSWDFFKPQEQIEPTRINKVNKLTVKDRWHVRLTHNVH